MECMCTFMHPCVQVCYLNNMRVCSMHVYVHVYVCACVRVCVCVHTHVCMHVCVCVCVGVCVTQRESRCKQR